MCSNVRARENSLKYELHLTILFTKQLGRGDERKPLPISVYFEVSVNYEKKEIMKKSWTVNATDESGFQRGSVEFHVPITKENTSVLGVFSYRVDAIAVDTCIRTLNGGS